MTVTHDPRGKEVMINGILELRVRALPFVIWLIGLRTNSTNRVNTNILATDLISLAGMVRSGSPLEHAIWNSLGSEVLEAWGDLMVEMPELEIVIEPERIIEIARTIKETGKGHDAGRGRVSASTVIKAITRQSSQRAA